MVILQYFKLFQLFFSQKFLSDKETFDQVADEFLSFTKDKKIIIHNASFDLGFLDGELESIQKEKIDKKLVIDSLEVARNKFPGTSNSLDALCKRFFVDNSNRSLHGALLDSELLAEVYLELVGGKEPDLELSTNTIKKDNNSQNKTSNISARKNKLKSRITNIDEKNHRDFDDI